MGITKNYQFAKKHCNVCDGDGIVEIPINADPLDWVICGQPIVFAGVEMVEETCPICDGKGWYYYEFED